MGRYISTHTGLQTLLKRLSSKSSEKDELEEYNYWVAVVKGCIDENLAMDETDYENSPMWFRKLWIGLK